MRVSRSCSSGSTTDRPVRLKSAAGWPFGSSRAAGWVMTAQGEGGGGGARTGAGSFTTSMGGPYTLALSHFEVRLPVCQSAEVGADARGSTTGGSTVRSAAPAAEAYTSLADAQWTQQLHGGGTREDTDVLRVEGGQQQPQQRRVSALGHASHGGQLGEVGSVNARERQHQREHEDAIASAIANENESNPLFGRLARMGLSTPRDSGGSGDEGPGLRESAPVLTPTPSGRRPKPLSAAASAALAAAGATPGSTLAAAVVPSPRRTPPRPFPPGTISDGGPEGGGNLADKALDALAAALSSRVGGDKGFVRGQGPGGEGEVHAAVHYGQMGRGGGVEGGGGRGHGGGMEYTGGSSGSGSGGGGDGMSAAAAASVVDAVQALGCMLDSRMDRIEAAMQSHERRLRKIEAAVVPAPAPRE